MKHCSQHAKHQVSRTSSAFIIIVFFFMISGGILVLLIFSNKVIHVALCLSEFPSHPFLLQCTSARRLSSWTWPRTARSLSWTSPVQKSIYQQKLRPWKGLSARDVTHTGLDIVGDPLNESRKSSCSAHSLSVRPLPLCSSFPWTPRIEAVK